MKNYLLVFVSVMVVWLAVGQVLLHNQLDMEGRCLMGDNIAIIDLLGAQKTADTSSLEALLPKLSAQCDAAF